MSRILVVEDDEITLTGLGYLLRQAGYGVIQARDGEKGLRRALRGDIDIIITDIRMPKLSGIEFATRLCAQEGKKTPPIIFVTGMNQSELEVHQKQLSEFIFVGVHTKPLNTDLLLEDIKLKLHLVAS